MVEEGENTSDDNDQNGNPESGGLKEMVAEILNEYANEARQAGIIPTDLHPNTPTAPPQIYQNLQTAVFHVTGL